MLLFLATQEIAIIVAIVSDEMTLDLKKGPCSL